MLRSKRNEVYQTLNHGLKNVAMMYATAERKKLQRVLLFLTIDVDNVATDLTYICFDIVPCLHICTAFLLCFI